MQPPHFTADQMKTDNVEQQQLKPNNASETEAGVIRIGTNIIGNVPTEFYIIYLSIINDINLSNLK